MSSMIYIAYVIRLFFTIYSLMILIRVLSSWFPRFQNSFIIRFIAHYTDPYINLFRRFIPLIGGVLDLSPLVAFFVLKLVEKLILMVLFS